MGEWQPIETAPKDGTHILVHDDIGYSVAAWEDRQNGPGASGVVQPPGWRACAKGTMVDDEGWDTGHGYKLELEPTHWMPLPAPPASSGG